MNRPGKPAGPHYLSHQTLDTDYGIILDVTVTPGDANDAVPYLDQIEHIHKSVIPVHAATADAAYDFPLAHRTLEDLEISFYARPQARPDNAKTEMSHDSFTYDEEKDVYICANGKTLKLTNLQRGGSGLSLLYRPERSDCMTCPMREKCMTKSGNVRTVSHSYFRKSVQKNYDKIEHPVYKDALRKRQIWCEGTFAIQKRCHNLTRVLRRGLEAAEDHCLLSATALNLKRLIKAI